MGTNRETGFYICLKFPDMKLYSCLLPLSLPIISLNGDTPRFPGPLREAGKYPEGAPVCHHSASKKPAGLINE